MHKLLRYTNFALQLLIRFTFMNIISKFKFYHAFALSLCAIAFTLVASSCNNTKSYAEYLADERQAVNHYLSGFRVINNVPEDSVFECGKDAPFYKLDSDGEVFMQVITPGDRVNNAPKHDQQIFFRYLRTNLLYLWQGYDVTPEGNANDMSYYPTWFRYNNYTFETSSQYGRGIQMPLDYLGIDCEVNLVIRSQYGITSEIGEVMPYLYNLRYFPASSI